MKKLLLALSIVLLLVSCNDEDMDNETETNPFVGTWKGEDNDYLIVFTSSTITGVPPDESLYYTGAYTYDNTHLTIYLDPALCEPDIVDSWGESHTIPYEFDNGDLLWNVSRQRLKKIK